MANEITKVVDATNRYINIGDTVAFIEQRGQQSPDLLVATVIGFTPKKIRLSYRRTGWRGDKSESITKYPYQCTRIDYSPEDLVLAIKSTGE
jgi:hypothetical protein